MEYPNLYFKLQQFAESVINKYKQKMQSHNASGHLLNNIDFKIDSSGSNIKVDLLLADYWYYLENGRGPTKSTSSSNPSLFESILSWIKVKGIVPQPDEKGRLPSEQSLAYLITRKIHNEGYNSPPQHCLSEAVNETYLEFKEQLEESLRQDFYKYFSIEMKKIKSIRL